MGGGEGQRDFAIQKEAKAVRERSGGRNDGAGLHLVRWHRITWIGVE